MSHGGPDWGTPGPLKTVYTLEDMAELAARLGSIVTFDRRGNVLFLENFDGSLAKCYHGSDGVGGSVSISNEKARHGNFSCKLVTGNVTDDEAWVGALLAYPALSRMGMEAAWALPTNCNVKAIFLFFDITDETEIWHASVKYVTANNTWYYWYEDDWVALTPTIEYYQGGTQFNHTKIVADFLNKKYIRLIANDLVYDLSGKALSTGAIVYPPIMEAEVCISTKSDAIATAYADSIIVTQNEP